MAVRVPARPPALPANRDTLRTLAEQAFSRTAGAPLVGGNAVRVLRDATENYPAWREAIARARRTIHIEMYIFHRDRVGRDFVAALTAKARAGIKVRVIYDWFGSGLGPRLGLFTPLIRAGGEVRPFNPPSLSTALGWLRRDHRKLLVIDGEIAYVSGLCIGEAWLGRPDRRHDPWRDTGLEIVGPVVGQAEQSFADSWGLAGGDRTQLLPLTPRPAAEPGRVNLRLIATEPFTANMLRLDLLVASLARRRLWIADAYFIGTGPYLEALKRAAADGVDVRLLLPQDSDVGWTVPVSRSLYRPLLEANVRIFEWSGTMIHAKTAVADSLWARIGSTNLNLNSWIGNWELDVAIEDDETARTLETHYEEDLERSTEIVLKTYSKPRSVGLRRSGPRPVRSARRARSRRRMARTVTGLGHSLGAAITGNRPLENFELAPLVGAGVLLAATALVGFFAPRSLAWPIAGLAAWTAITFFVEAWTVARRNSRKR
jgi:phosphatidylserine/phosphatidylglycerophosphate/cardiolipin synthase-like enzyme